MHKYSSSSCKILLVEKLSEIDTMGSVQQLEKCNFLTYDLFKGISRHKLDRHFSIYKGIYAVL